jgi:ribonuclease PH
MANYENNTRPSRHDGRGLNELRPLRASLDVFEFASGSVLLEVGRTKILCAVTLQVGVPPFLRGKGVGWLTAEYAMLPAATAPRTPRESSTSKKCGRSVEISRLIGRVMRAVTDLSGLGERTVTIDCDVLQADGGTRTASISAACLALQFAQKQWLASKIITSPILLEQVAAVSVGVCDDAVILDPDFHEDSGDINADFNFVITRSGNLIEIQGGAEKKPLAWQAFDAARALAHKGTQELFCFFDSVIQSQQQFAPAQEAHKQASSANHSKPLGTKAPLFSLLNRQKHAS